MIDLNNTKYLNNTNSSNITIFYKKNSLIHNNITDYNANIKTNGIDVIINDTIKINSGSIFTPGNFEVKSHIPSIGYFSFDFGVGSTNLINTLNSSSMFNYLYQNHTMNGLTINNKLSISKELFVSQNITAFSTALISDVKFKYNINDMTYGLEVINELKPVRYKWKKNNKMMVGFIAQDVEKVLPIIVKNDNNIKTLKIDKIIPYLVNSIKNINKRLNYYNESI